MFCLPRTTSRNRTVLDVYGNTRIVNIAALSFSTDEVGDVYPKAVTNWLQRQEIKEACAMTRAAVMMHAPI